MRSRTRARRVRKEVERMPLLVPRTPEETLAAWQATVSAMSRGTPDGLFRTVAATKAVKEYMFPAWPLKQAVEPAPQAVLEALAVVVEAGQQDGLLEWLKEVMRTQYEVVLASIEEQTGAWTEPVPPEQCLSLIAFWSSLFDAWYRPLRILTSGDASARDLFSTHLATLIRDTIPAPFPLAIRNLFHHHLTISPILSQPIPNPSPVPSTSSSSPPAETPASQLAKLGLLTKFQPILFSLVYDLIDAHLESHHAREWADERIGLVMKWLNEDVGGWLLELFATSLASDGAGADLQTRKQKAIEMVRPAMGRFEYHVYRQMAVLRTNEIFEIIIDFPLTKAALLDLKTCLSRTELRQTLVSKLRSANARRLLHPGADTRDIISQYIAMIKALKILDPPGVLLSRVADPVRRYLRTREDTIRCIVTSLVEPCHPLGLELAPAEEATGPSSSKKKGVEEGDYLDPDWTPDPVDAPPDYRSGSKRDIIESLVSIFQTRDGFIKEVQALLAQRLLAIEGFNVELELLNVEILKKRFGEAALQPCDVMLKDIADSKRADATFKEQAKASPLRALILSRMFWPNVAPATFRPSPSLTALHTDFEKVFIKQKADKRLRWVPQLATVDVEIELEDRTIRSTVTMLQASVADLFSVHRELDVDRVAKMLGMEWDKPPAINAVYFWANQGLLRQKPGGLFEVQERLRDAAAAPKLVLEETDWAERAARDERIQKMRVFWAYIQGMLTNLGTLPLDRIFSSLSILAPGFRGTTKDELRAFLEAMQAEGQVEPVGQAEWRLVAH